VFTKRCRRRWRRSTLFSSRCSSASFNVPGGRDTPARGLRTFYGSLHAVEMELTFGANGRVIAPAETCRRGNEGRGTPLRAMSGCDARRHRVSCVGPASYKKSVFRLALMPPPRPNAPLFAHEHSAVLCCVPILLPLKTVDDKDSGRLNNEA
jgi:hypothetical protein